MRTLGRSFVKGLLITVPLIGTVWIIYAVVALVDSQLGLEYPGAGLAITIAFIWLVGLLASNVLGKKVLEVVEKGIVRVPIVKLVYSSIKDLMGAFVGDKKSFDEPVMVEVVPDSGVRLLGFVTCRHFDDPKLRGHVAVYLPQSYNFAGNLVVVPRERVQPVDADGAQFLAFIVSGGVAEMSAARTIVDGNYDIQLLLKRKKKS